MPLCIYYFDKYNLDDVILENVIFIDYQNIHAYITVEDILAIIPDTSLKDGFSVSNIIDTILSLDLSKLVEDYSFEENNINLGISLDQFNLDLKNLIDTTRKISISIKSIDNCLSISSNELFNLDLKINSFEFESISLLDCSYVSLSNIINEVYPLISMINNDSIRINISGNIDISGLLNVSDIDMKANISGYIDLLLIDNQYVISGNLALDVIDISANIEFIYINDSIYLTLGEITIGLNVNELSSLIEEISLIFGISSDEASKPSDSNDMINNILKSIVILNESTIQLSLGDLIDKLSLISIIFLQTENDGISLNINASNNSISYIDADISINKLEDTYDVIEPNDYINKDQIITLCKYIGSVVDLFKSKCFKLSLGSKDSPMLIYKNNSINYKIYADIEMDFVDSFNVKLILKITEHDGKTLVSTHDLSIIIKDNMVYAVYGNANDDAKTLKVYSTLESIEGIIASIVEASGLDLSFMNDIIDFSQYLSEELKYVDFSQIRRLIGGLIPSSENNELDINLNLCNLLKQVFISDELISVSIFTKEFMDYTPEGDYIQLSLSRVNENDLPKIEIENIYTAYDKAQNKWSAIKNISISLNDYVSIEAPTSLDGYYDITSVKDLIDGLLVTSNQPNFLITGTVALNVKLGIISYTAKVPVSLMVEVDENGMPIILAHFNMTNLDALASTIISAKNSYILYKDNYVYIDRYDSKNHYQLKVHYETFLSDLVYYLMEYALGMSDSIVGLMTGSKTSSENIDASKIIREFSYEFDEINEIKKFNFSVDMEEATKNSDLGILSASLSLKKVVVSIDEDGTKHYAYALNSVENFNFNMVNVINLKCSNLVMSNIETIDNDNYFRNVYLDEFGSISLIKSDGSYSIGQYVDKYIGDNFSGIETDYTYKNGVQTGKTQHSVFFSYNGYLDEFGEEIPLYTIKADFGSAIEIPTPTVEFAYKNGRKYYFGGWYKDIECTIPYTEEDAVIGNTNTHVYAKWIEMYNFTVVDSFGDGIVESLKNGETTSYYTIENTENFIGFAYDSLGENMISTDGATIGGYLIAGNDITIYAIYGNMNYLVVNNKDYYILKDNDPSAINLEGEKYLIKADDRYYAYYASAFSSKMLLDCYGEYKVTIRNGNITNYYIYIESYKSIITGYNKITLSNVDSMVDLNGFELYFNIYYPSTTNVLVNELPYGIMDDYEINAWVDENNNYYSLSQEEIVTGTMSAYITTNKSYFNYNGTIITGLKTDVTISSVLVTPRYNENEEIVTEIGASAFLSNNTISCIILSDGMTKLGQDSFKNCTSLKSVYFADSVVSVSKDSFYFTSGKNYEANRDIAIEIRFYFTENSTCDKTKWLACKWNLTSKYYNESYTVLGSGNFKNAFQKYSGSLMDIVISQIY